MRRKEEKKFMRKKPKTLDVEKVPEVNKEDVENKSSTEFCTISMQEKNSWKYFI